MSGTAKRLVPWMAVAALVSAVAGAALASALTAPAAVVRAPGPTAPSAPGGAPSAASPGCAAAGGTSTLTLNDTEPPPAATVAEGSELVVIVPPWNAGQATQIGASRQGVLVEQCSVVLSSGGRRAVFLASSPGETALDATVTPASGAFMPAWFGEVTVVTSASPAPGVLTTTIELPSTTLVAGTTVPGTLVVRNDTVSTINLTQGCRSFWAVGLQSPAVPFKPAFPALCSTDPLLIVSGTNRFPFELHVAYSSCAMAPGGAGGGAPPCGANDMPPGLPPGRYQVIVVSETPVIHAEPLSVTVIAPSGQ
ncbi:MAG: hypothetical protein ACYDD4_07300 [Acidimicrobiales bacterium]